ncbi:choline-binding transcriptional repressor BetI [Microbaculum marinum]|uniref:HTH-type transcriptional regulator BetI n=1 Tax=Microbaculum marinum TaxID=1764581 RepID=A0AAW9RUD1_9HYPH
MPKTGMEPIRRRALISAAIETIHDRGFCDVTVGQIARRAGVSTALAHHYFGSKDQLLAETMRHLLRELGRTIVARLRRAATPRQRISAVISGNFAPTQFRPATISAWLAFYVQAQTAPEARRLHRIYARRLKSNLVHDLKALMPDDLAAGTAEGAAALIDGLWIRYALADGTPDPGSAIRLVEDYVESKIARGRQ